MRPFRQGRTTLGRATGIGEDALPPGGPGNRVKCLYTLHCETPDRSSLAQPRPERSAMPSGRLVERQHHGQQRLDLLYPAGIRRVRTEELRRAAARVGLADLN